MPEITFYVAKSLKDRWLELTLVERHEVGSVVRSLLRRRIETMRPSSETPLVYEGEIRDD